MSDTASRRFQLTAAAIAMAAVLIGAWAAYSPGLSGPFFFDDDLSIRFNDHLAMTSLTPAALVEAALSGNTGPLGRPVSMLTFALNRYATGLDPYYFKVTNLAIHLANGVCVFILSALLLRAYRRRRQAALPDVHVVPIAAAVSAVWLLHPLNLVSVLYIVQRMNELAALFTLCGLIFYVWGRLRMDAGGTALPLIIAGAAVFGTLAVLSKENGALLPLFMLVIEGSLFRFETPVHRGRRGLYLFFAVTVALPAAALLASLLIAPDWALQGYRARDFTLVQRLLTEARVMWHYLLWTVFPGPGQLGFFHDDIAASRSLMTPPTTLAAVAAHAAVLAGAVLARRRAPLFTLGVLFFYAGQVMESTIFPLEIVFEHRNYLPDFGLFFAGVFYLYRLVMALGRYRPAGYAAGALVIALLGYATAVRAGHWSDLSRFAAYQVTHHPGSPRANYTVGWLYYEGMLRHPRQREDYFDNARKYFSRATLASNDFAGGLFGLIMAYNADGRPADPGMLAMLRRRLGTRPFTSNDANWLRQLVMCQSRGRCRLSPAQVMGLLDAARTNRTIYGVNKAYVLSITSRYLVNMLKDYPGALRLAEKAARVVPRNLDFRLDVVDLLIQMGRYDQAGRELDEIKRLDTLGAYTSGIREQERRLPDQDSDIRRQTSDSQGGIAFR